MRKISVVLTISAFSCFCLALNLDLTLNVSFAQNWVWDASQDAQGNGDSSDVSIEFDSNAEDEAVEQGGEKTEKGESDDDSLEFDVNFSADLSEQTSDKTETDEDADLSLTSDPVLAEEEKEAEVSDVSVNDVDDAKDKSNQTDEKSDNKSVEETVVVSDEFEIDKNDILGSAFNGLIPSSDSLETKKTFNFEEEFAVERVGVFNAGAWSTERVERRKVAREAERVKYDDPVDAPDEYKSIEDFWATATAPERRIIDKGTTPEDAFDWFQFAREVAKVGRAEFAKRALEESFLAETDGAKTLVISNDELEKDARQFELDDARLRLERNALERLWLAALEYWSDASRFDDAFERLFSGSVEERSSALVKLVRAGDYGAARFCRLSLNKFANFAVDARGQVVFGDNLASSQEFAAYSQTIASYFERVGYGAAVAALWGTDVPAVEAIVESMKYADASYVWAELALRYYDKNASDSLRRAIERTLLLKYHKIPTRSQAVIMAYKQALKYYERAIDLPCETFPKTDIKRKTNFDADAKTFIWRWDDAEQAPKPVLTNVEYAFLYEAARLARAADKLARENRIANREARSLAIATTSELLIAQVGADAARSALSRFESACPNLTLDDLALAVQYAIKSKRRRGALIPMILLGDKGGSALFNATRSAPSIVVQGASCADRRVRYEALRAVFKQNPQRDFVGSRVVVQALEWFASAQGERVVVVMEPNSETAANIAERLEGFGFTAKTCKTVHEMLLEVQKEADLEFVFLPDGLDLPTLQRAAKTLRFEQATAETPLLVGTLDEKAEVFDLEADELAGLRFYDSVAPSNASVALRARQAKCAERALKAIQQLRSDALNKSDQASKRLRSVQTTPVPRSNEESIQKPLGKVRLN